MTQEELTWIATVFDCEGNLTAQRYTKKNGEISEYPLVQIGHCSPDLLARFHTLIGVGKIYTYEHKSSEYSYKKKDGTISRYDYRMKKQVYWWKLHGRENVSKFIALIWNEWISEYRRETAFSLGVAPMAKHAHKFLLVNKKTWKCMLDNCPYFVHLGLVHVLIGKRAICWNCEEEFIVDDRALRDEKPKCIDCRLASSTESLPEESQPEESTDTPEQIKAREKLWREMFGK